MVRLIRAQRYGTISVVEHPISGRSGETVGQEHAVYKGVQHPHIKTIANVALHLCGQDASDDIGHQRFQIVPRAVDHTTGIARWIDGAYPIRRSLGAQGVQTKKKLTSCWFVP